ncbi:MAG: hypothetical protein Q8L60_15865 [Gammaproteobacteria bacterium]|nr:hypothetical protein [Gammaproteobacteria bacterium]MDP2141486.1 hypothetical protein [Gammaproteobacteria bacterium]MDP2347489.1 hypothetical protein [Gammaproteobacteria bacterium]
MNNLSRWLHKHTNGRSLALTFALTFAIIALMQSSLPMTNTALLAVSGENILDITFYYDSGEALRRAEAYGPEGRSIYLRFLLLDFLFIPAYSLAAAFLISALARKADGISDSRANLLPLLMGLGDFIENNCTLMLLTSYPDSSTVIASIGSSATMLKYLFGVATLGAVLNFMARRFAR